MMGERSIVLIFADGNAARMREASSSAVRSLSAWVMYTGEEVSGSKRSRNLPAMNYTAFISPMHL